MFLILYRYDRYLCVCTSSVRTATSDTNPLETSNTYSYLYIDSDGQLNSNGVLEIFCTISIFSLVLRLYKKKQGCIDPTSERSFILFLFYSSPSNPYLYSSIIPLLLLYPQQLRLPPVDQVQNVQITFHRLLYYFYSYISEQTNKQTKKKEKKGGKNHISFPKTIHTYQLLSLTVPHHPPTGYMAPSM